MATRRASRRRAGAWGPLQAPPPYYQQQFQPPPPSYSPLQQPPQPYRQLPPPPPYPPPQTQAQAQRLAQPVPPQQGQGQAPGRGQGPAAEDGEGARLRAELEATIIERPSVAWSDVIGQEAVLSQIETIVREPLDNPNANLKWSGILLYGPPGTGKSLTAKAIATSAAPAKFMSLSSADLFGRFHGESENRVKAAFAVARANRPIIMFIDEIDAIFARRAGAAPRTHPQEDHRRGAVAGGGGGDDVVGNRVKTQFLIEMDGVGKDRTGVLVVAATNNPWVLDEALLRRLPQKYYIGLPNAQSRVKMLDQLLARLPNDVSAPQRGLLGLRTRGMSGSELRSIVENATVRSVTRRRAARAPPGSERISLDDLEHAISETGRAVTPANIERYRAWAADHGLRTNDIDADLRELTAATSPAPGPLTPDAPRPAGSTSLPIPVPCPF